MTNENILKTLKKIFGDGDLKTILACAPVIILLLNLGYYAYYQGFFYFFKIHSTYMEMNNFSVLSVLFWITLIATYLFLNYCAFLVVVRKNGAGYIVLFLLLIVPLVVKFSIDMKGVIVDLTDFKMNDVIYFLIMLAIFYLLVYCFGIYVGVCVRLEDRKKIKKKNPPKSKPVNKPESQTITNIKLFIERYSYLMYIPAGFIIWSLVFCCFGAMKASQTTEFKVINDEYAVIYESADDFLLAKVEDGKINILVQKTIKKENVEIEIKNFDGNFIIRYTE